MINIILQVAILATIVMAFGLIWKKLGGQTPIKTNCGKGKRKVFIDTSTLMDGRILSVAQTGFLGDHFLIPNSVLREMQTLADGPDTNKRTRARFGMDVAKDFQAIDGLEAEIFDDSDLKGGVDNRLVKLATEHNATILTNDYNLGKLAMAQGIKILNVNDLTQSLRSEMLPGEKTVIELIQKGSVNGQAVGYLSDGTMVVVNHADNLIGQSVEVEMDRYLQTAAGKMLFAKLVEQKTQKQPEQKNHKQAQEPKKQHKNNSPKQNRKPRVFHSEDM